MLLCGVVIDLLYIKYIMEVLLIVMNGGMYYVEENWFFFVMDEMW